MACTILSLAVENAKYKGVVPLLEYDESIVCLKEGACKNDTSKIKYVLYDASVGKFLYFDHTPLSMQGYQNPTASNLGYCLSVCSFVESK